jgi:dihydrofolate reductase
MYETRVYWETADTGPDQPVVIRDWTAIWRGAEKIVYSRTLDEVSSARTRIERDFDPEQIRQLKRDAGADLSIGGAGLAGQALAAGLVDECHLILHPVLVGGGKRALPPGVHVQLRLLDERRFADGVAYLGYRVRA